MAGASVLSRGGASACWAGNPHGEASLCHQLGLLRATLTGAHPRIGQEVLELLVLEQRVTVDDVRGVPTRYRLGGGG